MTEGEAKATEATETTAMETAAVTEKQQPDSKAHPASQQSVERENLLFMAKLAEQTSRTEECVEYMNSLVRLGQPLTDDERNLFSVAYKNLINNPRTAWRLFSTGEAKEAARGNTRHAELIRTYKLKIETELERICNEIMELLDNFLIPSVATAGDAAVTDATPAVSKAVQCGVFYHKMKGDYFRYMAEFVSSTDKKDAVIRRAQESYEQATDLAASLPCTNIVRLGLALNFSVFYYEIKNMPDVACKIAKETYDNASQELKSERLQNSAYNDITIILQLFQDNLTLWNAEEEAHVAAAQQAANPQ